MQLQRRKMKPLSHNQPTRLHNIRCAYCNAEFERSDEPQKEHVIGRLFVPKGMHEQQWNLHLNSCFTCNQTKSQLENDISAISMIHTPADALGVDSTLASESHRKRKTKSQFTGRAVADSNSTFEFTAMLGLATIKFSTIGPPQVDAERVFLLALYQLRGFHYFLTYDANARCGYRWDGIYAPLGCSRRSDWGNPLIVTFSELVGTWQMRLNAPTSNGYYRVLIKKSPTDSLWSWALEWNKILRVFGLYGDEAAVENAIAQVRNRGGMNQMSDIDSATRRRVEVPTSEDGDRLFDVIA